MVGFQQTGLITVRQPGALRVEQRLTITPRIGLRFHERPEAVQLPVRRLRLRKGAIAHFQLRCGTRTAERLRSRRAGKTKSKRQNQCLHASAPRLRRRLAFARVLRRIGLMAAAAISSTVPPPMATLAESVVAFVIA